jgi:hypothetical protein
MEKRENENEKVMNGVRGSGWFFLPASNRRSWKFMLMLCDTDLCIISGTNSDFSSLSCCFFSLLSLSFLLHGFYAEKMGRDA